MILVTGSTGIVGTRILFDLLKSGERVRALKRKTSDIEFVQKVFDFYDAENGNRLFENIEWFDGDITDIESLAPAFKGITHCYHCAALVSYDPRDRENLLEINGEGTANVVNAALENGVLKICHISSVSALGRAKKGTLTDEKNHWTLESNASNYGMSKFMAEREVWRGTAEGLPAVIVNPGVILGPSKPDQSSGMLMSVLKKGVAFYPKGVVGYVDVRDVSEACINLMNSEIKNKRYLLIGENKTYLDFLSTAARIFGNKPPKIKLQPWMLTLGWVGAKAVSLILGKKPKITREVAQSSSRENAFSNEKIRAAISFEFVPVDEALVYYRPFYD